MKRLITVQYEVECPDYMRLHAISDTVREHGAVMSKFQSVEMHNGPWKVRHVRTTNEHLPEG